jgi:Cu/Zn superoxide dismutase
MRLLTLLAIAFATLLSSTSVDAVDKAVCRITRVSGDGVKGTVTFTQVPDPACVGANPACEPGQTALETAYDFTGLPVGKNFGFHIHQYGDARELSAGSAGKHFIANCISVGSVFIVVVF